MNSSYQSNIQPIQGWDIQFSFFRGFTPTFIQIVPLRGTNNLMKSNASVIYYTFRDYNIPYQNGNSGSL
jgi:hypothetical protein